MTELSIKTSSPHRLSDSELDKWRQVAIKEIINQLIEGQFLKERQDYDLNTDAYYYGISLIVREPE